MVFDQIRDADIVIIYNEKGKKIGYVGLNTAVDLGYAIALGKTIIFLYEPVDPGIRGLIEVLKNIKVIPREK